MLTLWDLIAKPRRRRGRSRRGPGPAPAPAPIEPTSPTSTPPPAAPRRRPMQDRYDALVRDMLARYGIRVRKWRSSMTGVAWEVHYRDGSVSRLIEAPRPRGPMSAAIFLHEIGHHAIGFGTYRPRCLEEHAAWAWALAEMERQGLNVTDGVRHRMHESLAYAVDKARRRGLKRLPAELAPYARYPEPRRRRAPDNAGVPS